MNINDLLERQGSYYINSGTQVWLRYAVELANNGEYDHNHVSLMIAPAVNEEEEYLWLETNGEPVPVGVLLPDDSGVEFLAEVAEWIDEPEYAWIHAAISELQGE